MSKVEKEAQKIFCTEEILKIADRNEIDLLNLACEQKSVATSVI